MDNAPITVLKLTRSRLNTCKRKMRQCLFRKGVCCDEKMHKQDLYCPTEAHRLKENTFRIDAILEAFGHTPLRLPPYMRDLNATELRLSLIHI